MTDSVEPDVAHRLARLQARRSGSDGAMSDGTDPGTPGHDGTDARPSAASDTAARTPTPIDRSGSETKARTRRRRSPASVAKIVTVGASTTAVLGLMTGFGLADRLAAGVDALGAAPSSPASVPSSTLATSVPNSAPAIVIVVDGSTGAVLSTTRMAATVDEALAADRPPSTPAGATAAPQTQPQLIPEPTTSPVSSAPEPVPEPTTSLVSSAPEPVPEPTTSLVPSAPEPVPAPTRVELAVPAPPQPVPAPAKIELAVPAPPPAHNSSAPTPQASSDAS